MNEAVRGRGGAPSRIRRIPPPALGVVLIALVACSSPRTVASRGAASPTGAPPAATATASMPTPTPSPAPAAPAGVASASPSGATAVGRCHTSDLSLSLGATTQNAPEQYQVRLLLTNRSSRTCSTFGFPGVDLEGPPSAAGTTLSLPRQAATPQTVVLPPGSTAHSLLTYLLGPDVCDTNGPWVPRLVVVTPPDETTQLTTAWSSGRSVDNCQASATHPGTYVGPVQPGSG